jgi:chromosome segregation ATPase
MSAKVCSHAEAIAELKALAPRLRELARSMAESLADRLEAPVAGADIAMRVPTADAVAHAESVTREELDRVDSLAADRDATIGARIAGLSNRIDGVVRRQSCTEQQLASIDGRAIALAGYVAELSSRADKLESRVSQQSAVTREEFDALAATVGDIANALGRERVVERLGEHSGLLASLSERISISSHAIEAHGVLIEESRKLSDELDKANKAIAARLHKLESNVGIKAHHFLYKISDIHTELENVLISAKIMPRTRSFSR